MASKIVKSEAQIETEVKKKLHNDLYTYLVCQKCQIVPKTGTIYACPKAEHAICAACFVLTKICTICKTAVLPTPSKILEQLRTSLPISCKNRKNGCKTVLTMDSLVYHEVECEWRKIVCPDFFCKIGNVIYNMLSQHMTEHKNQIVDKEMLVFEQNFLLTEEYLSKSSLIWYPIPFSQKQAKFFLELVLQNGRFYLWVYYHGSPEEAKNYTCNLKVFGDCDAKFIYNGIVRSLDEPKETVFKDGCALDFSLTQARLLVSNTVLKCSVQVSCPKEEAKEEAKKEDVESDVSD
jgi:hypothetical protein